MYDLALSPAAGWGGVGGGGGHSGLRARELCVRASAMLRLVRASPPGARLACPPPLRLAAGRPPRCVPARTARGHARGERALASPPPAFPLPPRARAPTQPTTHLVHDARALGTLARCWGARDHHLERLARLRAGGERCRSSAPPRAGTAWPLQLLPPPCCCVVASARGEGCGSSSGRVWWVAQRACAAPAPHHSPRTTPLELLVGRERGWAARWCAHAAGGAAIGAMPAGWSRAACAGGGGGRAE